MSGLSRGRVAEDDEAPFAPGFRLAKRLGQRYVKGSISLAQRFFRVRGVGKRLFSDASQVDHGA